MYGGAGGMGGTEGTLAFHLSRNTICLRFSAKEKVPIAFIKDLSN